METNYKNFNKILDTISEISQPIFISSLFTYFLLMLLEGFRKGFVNVYLDINIFLWITLISGVLLVLLHNEEDDQTSKLLNSRFITTLIAIIGGLIIYFQIKDIGWVSILISVMATAIILLISKTLDSEEQKNSSN